MGNYEMYLGDIEFPIAQEEIEMGMDTESVTHNVLGIGEIEIVKGKKLRNITFSGFFPYFELPSTINFKPPSEYVEIIEGYIKDRKIVRFLYIGAGHDINLLVTIHGWSYREMGGDIGTLWYSLELHEFVEYSAKKIQVEESGASSITQNNTQRKDTKTVPKKYTVKEGDTLSKIAKNTLGDSGDWTKVYSANKDIIKNPNLIYAGQELTIPSGGLKDANGVTDSSKTPSFSKDTQARNNAKTKPNPPVPSGQKYTRPLQPLPTNNTQNENTQNYTRALQPARGPSRLSLDKTRTNANTLNITYNRGAK